MLTKEQQKIQELLSHPGWEIYQVLVRGLLKQQLQVKLHAAARSGEPISAATFAGQIDLLEIILNIPNEYLQKGQNHTST